MQDNQQRPLMVLVLWEETLHHILNLTIKFPKSVRVVFAQRIDNLLLDIAEDLAAARYAPAQDQQDFLQQVNQKLSRLRLLLRISADRRYLSIAQLRQVTEKLQRVGLMVNAWYEQL